MVRRGVTGEVVLRYRCREDHVQRCKGAKVKRCSRRDGVQRCYSCSGAEVQVQRRTCAEVVHSEVIVPEMQRFCRGSADEVLMFSRGQRWCCRCAAAEVQRFRVAGVIEQLQRCKGAKQVLRCSEVPHATPGLCEVQVEILRCEVQRWRFRGGSEKQFSTGQR